MIDLRVIFSLVRNNIRKWTINPRIYILIISFVLYFYTRLLPINDFCTTFGYQITPYIFPFIMTEPFSVMLIMLGIIFLLCDAPFIENEQPYVILRSNRTTWAFAQIVYIIAACSIYLLFIILITVIILLPNLDLSLSWGKVISTFSQTTLAPQHGIFFNFDFKIIHAFTPAAAMGISFLLSLAVAVFIGLCIFVLNMHISRAAGNITACVFVLGQVAASNAIPSLIKYSPVSWVSLSKVDLKGNTVYPSLAYIFVLLFIFIIALGFAALYSVKKKDIEVLKSF